MIRARWALSTALLLVGVANVAAQGRLQAARDEVRPSSSSDSSSDDSRKDKAKNSDGDNASNSDSCDSSEPSLDLFGCLLAPIELPRLILRDDRWDALAFAPHPYAGGYRGYQIVSPELAAVFYGSDLKEVPRKSWAARVTLDDGNEFDGLNRAGGQLKLEHASRWGVVTNWNWYHEKLPCGCTDDTLIGDANLTYRFAQNEIAGMYAGMGFRMLTDRYQSDFGVNLTYGGDWFPVRPFVVSGVIDAGNLGHAGVFHARGSIGAIWHGCEIFAGYDYLLIGRVDLQGPMAGVRFWF